jgi:hypothetical protein
MNADQPAWLILVLTLPTENATTRMRVWRMVKRLGCASLRDGVYLLPANAATRRAFADLAGDTRKGGGAAWVLDFRGDTEQKRTFRDLFDRTDDYEALRKELLAARTELEGLEPEEAGRRLPGLQRRCAALAATDYFPGPGRERLLALWKDIERRVQARLAPGEPSSAERAIPQLKVTDYQGKVWATRRGLWVDRMASAWLIARFVDRKARFLWLDKPEKRPRNVLGFDFDGAVFTHVGERVTFEVLLASFGLERDVALVRLGRIVRALDVGGDAPEAAGLEALLLGVKTRVKDDDALREQSGKLFDDLYAAFARKENKT